MKNFPYYLFFLIGVLFCFGCDSGGSDDSFVPNQQISQEQLVLRKFVVIGDSLTSGFQSNGLSQEFQVNSYPALIAEQISSVITTSAFEQPLVASPGIGGNPGKTPFTFVGGVIVENDLLVDPFTLLINDGLDRPYDNLGVPGADAFDVQNTLTSVTNPFFDIVLRNPTLGNREQLEQGLSLDPSLILLWIGNNDILGAATQGGNLGLITSETQFESEYNAILTEIRNRTGAFVMLGNIPTVTDIPFVKHLDGIFRTDTILGPTPVPVIFDETFTPVDFGGGLFVPLVTEEASLSHVLISGLSAYLTGVGVPDQAALEGFGFDTATAIALETGMTLAGLTPTGIPLPGTTTLTTSEESSIIASANGFNTIISNLAASFGIPVADTAAGLSTINNFGIDGFTANFVLQDPINTAFSLDGIHPNNAGYAITANVFIEEINSAFSVNIPFVNTEPFRGQYASGVP